MATFAFTPSATAAFQFQPTLDDNVYTCVVTWNLFGQRYYLNVYQDDGTLVTCRAMVGSPPGFDINLVGGLFTTSSLIFRQQDQIFEVTP